MYGRLVTASVIALLVRIFQKNGGLREIISFSLFKDRVLVDSIISNILVVMIFAELYWLLDHVDDEDHFGFDDPLDAYYFSMVTSSSVGYGDILPLTRKAKVLNMLHIISMFFVVLPIVFEALKPGN